jgi:hypothetical protein
VCALKYGVVQHKQVKREKKKLWCMVCAINFSTVWCRLGGVSIILARTVCTRIILVHVVCALRIGRAHRKSFSAHAMLVCSAWMLNIQVVRRFNQWCARSTSARWEHTKIWHGATHRVKCAWNFSMQHKNCVQ